MKKHWLKYAAITGFSIFFACSFGKIRVRNYYIINYKPTSIKPAVSMRPYPYSLQIGRFEVQRIFNRQNILYRFSTLQIQYYEFHHWAVRPDYMITDMVFKHLETSGLTNRTGIDFFETRPDFRIEGMVEALEKLDAGDMFFAHLAMSFKMLRVEDGIQVWEYSFDQRKQVYQQEMAYAVRGLSSILQAQMDVVVSQLDSLFLSMEKGPPEVTAPSEEPPEKTTPIEPSSEDLDESEFEIIPERDIKREEE